MVSSLKVFVELIKTIVSCVLLKFTDHSSSIHLEDLRGIRRENSARIVTNNVPLFPT